MKKYLFTFQSTHQALTAEKMMKGDGCPCCLITTPTEIFAECGFSLEIEKEDLDYPFSFAECYLINQTNSDRRQYEQIHPEQS